MDIRTIDLFAGAGGLSLGFEQAELGFVTVFAVEIDKALPRGRTNGTSAVRSKPDL
jgi:predicted RNA methylase